jgi:hypothetical protein
VRQRDPAHLAWLRTQPCCVPTCTNMNIQAHHVRSAANSGTGLRPPDSSAVAMCRVHHHEGHSTGWRTFEAKYGIDLAALAREYALLSGREMP